MEVRKNREEIKISFEEFLVLAVSEPNGFKNLNIKNPEIKSLFKKLFKKFISEDGVISYSTIYKWILRNIKFKNNKWSNDEYWVERGWSSDVIQDLKNEKLKELKTRNRLSPEYYLKQGYTEEEAKSKISKIQKENSKNRDHSNNKGKNKEYLKTFGYSEEEIERICNVGVYTINYYLKQGYTEEEAKSKISKIQKENSKKKTIKIKSNPDVFKNTYPNQIGYWTSQGYSEEESTKRVSDYQRRFSLSLCLEKYGEEKGIETFNKRQEKWLSSLYKNGKLNNGYSAISQELFYKICKRGYNDNLDELMFGENGGEKVLIYEGKYYRYDFLDIGRKKIIEFQGDIYHGNPRFFNDDDICNPFKKHLTVSDIREIDNYKKLVANNLGYEVLCIWEYDYRENKNEVIDKCIRWLLS